jgi:uncharacterized protein (DUF983 family)
VSKTTWYPPLAPSATGMKGKCPRCGKGALFAGYLDIAPECSVCGLDYGFADAGDGATWFVTLIAGTLAVAAVLWVELTWSPSYWVHALIAVPLAVVLPLVLLRPVKGWLVAQQFRTRAAEGRRSGP